MAFVHLHNHSEYSLLDGATHIKDMVRRAAELDMPAVALTDHGVMSGVPELAQACMQISKETGKEVKPLYGCEVYLTLDESLSKQGRPTLYHLVLIAKNNVGYHNLLRLVSKSQLENFHYKPRTTLSLLREYSEGLIGLSACLAGLIARFVDEGKYSEAKSWAAELASCFAPGDFYIELQDHGIVSDNQNPQAYINSQLVGIAEELNLPLVATNDFHYLLQEDAAAQDLLMCIGMGTTIDNPNRLKMPNDQFYMKTEEEMRAIFAEYPQACDNTIEIANKCHVELERESILPRFPLPEGESEESYFRQKCEEGLVNRYGENYNQEVKERYEHEASVIIQQGFPAYFLIVQEYIAWAKSQGIGVGPGRGSAAGSIVAYALGITDIEPLSNGLLFERFLSPERIEMPDIDVDFEDERRDEVIDHVREIYGEERVSGVITFGKLQAKNAVRDAARVMNYPYTIGDKIAKLIGNELDITIDKALETNPDLKGEYESDPDVKIVIDAAKSIEGNIRGEGVHACARIICRDPMTEHVPMKRDTKGGDIITQFDGHYTPDLGLLKMDFLGLRTLGVLSRACRNIYERFGVEIIPDQIPLDDPKSFDLMCGEGSMDGLFQVESDLYVKLFARMKPRSFSDIVASIALNRPGPLENGFVDLYVDRRQGKQEVSYYDDRLKPLLEETYGTIVYQEQIMQISMAMSGFSAGKADRLRKAMGKKKIDVMMQLKDDWCQGAKERGYSLEVAKRIWSDAEEFAKYAFNKSHSAAYAVLVMRTAYLKAHYPHEFMAAVLSSFMGKSDKLIRYIASCKRNNIAILPPDINSSNLEFTPLDEGIRFGLAGIRGVGSNVAEEIIAERKRGGNFSSVHDFINRINARFWNRKTLEALIKAGAFDSTGYTRKHCMYFVDSTSLLDTISKRQRDQDKGQFSIFDTPSSDGALEDDLIAKPPPPNGVEWDQKTLLDFEKEILKIYVSDHPLSRFEEELTRKAQYRLSDLVDRQKDLAQASFAGMISNVTIKLTRKGKKMCNFELEDTTGHAQCVCFDFEKYSSLIREDAIVVVKGNFEHSDFGDQIIVQDLSELKLENLLEDGLAVEDFILHLNEEDINLENLVRTQNILSSYPGKSKARLNLARKGSAALTCTLPLSVDADSSYMLNELYTLFRSPVWKKGVSA